jgi:subtilase family serine protease
LVVKNVTVPSIGVKGKTITVVNSIKTQGNTGSKGFYVNYYLKNTSSSKPIYIGRRYVTSLGAGKTLTQNTELTIPTAIANTSYYIMVYADYTNLIKESNETNNHNYSKTKINILNSGRPVYITSDNINKYTADDIARINNIVLGLQSLGLYAVNYGRSKRT